MSITNLTTSKLQNVSIVSPGGILDTSTYFQLYLKDIYVNVKASIYDLKQYVFSASTTKSLNIKYNLFDIYYTACNKVNVDEAWPLVIDNSISPLNIKNVTAPNWINNAYISTIHEKISSTYPSFWAKLLELIEKNAISYELIDNNNPNAINDSQYMVEYSRYGYTGKFLIDLANSFVAAPIVNNLFMRCANSVDNIGVTVSDTIKNHLHPTPYTLAQQTGHHTYSLAASALPFSDTNTAVYTLSAQEQESSEPDITTGDETYPNNIAYVPVLVIKSDISPVIINIKDKFNKNSNIPIGSIFPYTNKTLNNKSFLICDGSYYRISDYQELFNKIGHTFSDPSYGWNKLEDTNIYFRVPDFRNKYISYTNDSKKLLKYIKSNINTDLGKKLLKHYHGVGEQICKEDRYHGYYYSSTYWSTPDIAYNFTSVKTHSGHGYNRYGFADRGAISTTEGIAVDTTSNNSIKSLDTSHSKYHYIIKAK